MHDALISPPPHKSPAKERLQRTMKQARSTPDPPPLTQRPGLSPGTEVG